MVREARDGGFVLVGDAETSAYLAKTDSAGNVAAIAERTEAPMPDEPLTVSPNPCNRFATLRYQVDRSGPACLAAYDMAGRCVRTLFNGNQPPGDHEVVWNRDDDARRRLPEGVYFLRLSEPGLRQTRKIVLTE